MSSEASHSPIKVHISRQGFSLQGEITIHNQGITVFYGPSGCGKTSILRIIAGLEKHPGSEVKFQDHTWQDHQTWVHPHLRSLGYVFQEPTLFPHMTVKQNLEYGLHRRRITSQEFLTKAILLLGLEHLLRRYPEGLSGGERQRVAIARALASGPGILLLDEPLASLDQNRKQEILPFLENLRREWDIPMVYVTHSPEEMTRLGDHLVVFGRGQILSQGPLGEVLAGESSPFRLTEEEGVVLEGTITSRDTQWNLCGVSFPGGQILVRDPYLPLGGSVRVRILAKDVSVSLEESTHTSIINNFSARVEEILTEEHPALALVKLRMGRSAVLARVTRMAANRLNLAAGTQVFIHIKSAACMV